MVIGILKVRALETNAVGKQCMHHEHHFERLKVKLPGSGKETVYDSCASLSLPTLHRTPPPLPPSGSSPGHCQKVKNPKLIHWGKREKLRSAMKFSHVVFTPSLFNVTTTSESRSQLLSDIGSGGGLHRRTPRCTGTQLPTVLFQQGRVCAWELLT